MWGELSHALLRIKVLLAKSKAYHDEELEQSVKVGDEAENLKWHLHLDKMESFDLATILLGKINELTARMVFERLGASLIPNLDTMNPEWEREITWTNIKNGLANKAGNPHLAVIPAAEYETIRQIFSEFLATEHGRRGWSYRIRLVHRITPSVDNPGFYTHLENLGGEPMMDENGQLKGWRKSIGGLPTKAEFAFTDLYDDAVQTFRHYVALLERLNALPRFGPQAEPTSLM
jgi:hypothetical protein